MLNHALIVSQGREQTPQVVCTSVSFFTPLPCNAILQPTIPESGFSIPAMANRKPTSGQRRYRIGHVTVPVENSQMRLFRQLRRHALLKKELIADGTWGRIYHK
ncbi:MAG: hypothetical protein ABFS02_07575, partial [Pseudomonadota bacterium]